MSARDTIIEKLYNMTQYNLFIIYDNQMSEDENSFVQKLLKNKVFYGDFIDGQPHTSHKQNYSKKDIVKIVKYRYDINNNNYYILLSRKQSKALEHLRSHLYLYFKKQMGNYRPTNPQQRSFQGNCPFKIAFAKYVTQKDYSDSSTVEAVLDLIKQSARRKTIDVNKIPHYFEGREKEMKIIYHSRNINARLECLRQSKGKCYICGFDFEKVYGDIGKGFLEVHHKTPVSTYTKEQEISVDQLCAVCSNCHSMIHRTKTPMDVEELKRKIQRNKRPKG